LILPEKRWIQRFDNYLNVLRHLEDFVATTETRPLSTAEEFAVIKAFELVFECAWNVLKDFLHESGHSQIYGSRDAIRLAFRVSLIEDGEIWFDMIKKRNNTSCAYDGEVAQAVSLVVSSKYIKEFKRFRSTFEELRKKVGLMFGLPGETIRLINEVFSGYPKIEKVLIYGSRARGDCKSGSDIDLTIVGDISVEDKMHIAGLIDDLPIPYMCDLSVLAHIKNENLVEHIRRVGQVFYENPLCHLKQK